MKKVKGLSKKVSFGEPVLGTSSPFPHYGAFGDLIRAEDVDLNFNLDQGFIMTPCNYWIYPTFEEKTVLKMGNVNANIYNILRAGHSWASFLFKFFLQLKFYRSFV